MKLPESEREWFVDVALRYHGVPYKWGGDDSSGFDCSGLVLEAGKSVGLFPRGGFDLTAAMMYEWLKNKGAYEIDPAEFPMYPPVGEWGFKHGCLVFWNKPNKPIHHVEIALNDALTIGASGGNSKTTTINRAIQQNAFIKIRPLTSRGGHIRILDPFTPDS